MADYLSKPWPQGHAAASRARKRVAFAVTLLLAVFCLSVMLFAVRAAASPPPVLPGGLPIEVCGYIAEGTWTAGGSYHVTCDSLLPPETTLNIQPGVEVQFTAGFSLTVEGTLSAIGTPDQPITFTSDLAEPAPGDWAGLHFVAGSSDSELSWCLVEYATTGVRVYAGPGETVGPAFSSCTVRYNSLHGIQIEGEALECDVGLAQPTITRCTIESNGGCGIYGQGYGDESAVCSDFAPGSVGGVVSRSAIRQNQDAGIYLHAEWKQAALGDVWIDIEANAISGNGGHGLYLDDDDPIHLDDYDLVHPRIENNLIYENSGSGILSDAKHEVIELVVANNTVVANGGDGVTFNRSALLVHFVNNIVVENGGYGLVADATNDPQASNNDLWHNASGGYDGCLPGIDDIFVDPLFVDREAADFHLRFGSLCIDAGTSEGAPLTDIEGNTRPQGDGIDIGAYELWYQRTYLPLVLRE